MESDFICLLKDGEVLEKGTFRQLMAMKGAVSELIKTAGQSESGPSSSAASPSGSDSETSTIIDAASSQEKDEMEEAQDRLSTLEPIKPGPATAPKRRTGSSTTLRRASAASFRGPRGKLTDEEATSSKTRQAKEFSEQGKVKWSVYGEYARTSNLGAVAIYLLTLVAAQTAQIGGSVWLKEWSERNAEVGGNSDVGKWIGIYFAFGVGSSALTVVQTLILWIFCSIEVRIRR